MRITIAGGPLFPIPALDGGSVPRMWQGLAAEFARAGHDVLVWAKRDARQPDSEIIGNVKYRRRGGFRQSQHVWLDLARGFPDSLGTTWALPRADILVTNDFWLPALTPLLRPGAGRVVVNANRFPKGQYRLYRRASAVAAVSNAVAQGIREQAPALGAKVHVIPNALDLGVFSPGPAPETRSWAPLRLLYAGRIHPEKGLELLIGAVRLALSNGADLRLTIVGPYRVDQGGGSSQHREQLKASSQGLPVTFLEPVFDAEKLAELYRQHDIFCYPSLAERGESFGLAPVEAMACGLVPIVSALECFTDFIQDGTTGFRFDHRSMRAADLLAERLAMLAAHRQRLDVVSRQAHLKAASYDYPAVAARYLELFEGLIQRSLP